MKKNEIDDFILFLKKCSINKLYISQEFVNWLNSKTHLSEIEAIELFENQSKKIYKRINDYILKCSNEYLIPEFFFDEYDEDCLIKSEFLFNKEDQETITFKIGFRARILELLKIIDWREFEKVASLILKENHISNIRITQSKNDQGIDFYGFYNFRSKNLLPRFYKYLNFRIIGQVKHSENDNAVDHQKVASFGTELNKLRKAKDSSYFRGLDTEFIESELPVIGIFITNSYYPKKSIDFAKEYGIIYWNGEQVAEDLCSKELITSIFDEENDKLRIDLFKETIGRLG